MSPLPTARGALFLVFRQFPLSARLSSVSCSLAKWLNQDKAQGSAATRFSVHAPAVVAQSPLLVEGAEGPL